MTVLVETRSPDVWQWLVVDEIDRPLKDVAAFIKRRALLDEDESFIGHRLVQFEALGPRILVGPDAVNLLHVSPFGLSPHLYDVPGTASKGQLGAVV